MKSAQTAAEVTARSRSNLAASFLALPGPVRLDIKILYAFCREVDDLVDEPGPAPAARAEALRVWRRSLEGPVAGEPALAPEVRALAVRRGIPITLLGEILDGVEMDLDRRRYATLAELSIYCHRVAGCVGLASLRVFGCDGPATRTYALELGHALQWTNILRDVAADLRERDRLYLPLEDLARFRLTEAELPLADSRFAELMEFEGRRARGRFRAVLQARAELTRTERRALAAAEFMRDAYDLLLRRMRRDGFRVFHRNYRLSSADKLWLLARALVRRAVP